MSLRTVEDVTPFLKLQPDLVERILSFLSGPDIFRFLYITVYELWPWEQLTITHLNFADSGITDRALSYLTRSHIPLKFETIDLSRCVELSGRSFKYLPANLENLNLSGCRSLSDKYLKSLKSHKLLRVLNLAHCTRLSDQTLMALLQELKNLRQVNVHGCPLLSQIMHKTLARSPSKLQVDVFNVNVLPLDPDLRR